MPPIGLLLGKVDFATLFAVLKQGEAVAGPYISLADAQAAGAVTINYGVFISILISFIVIAFAIFMVIRYINKLTKKEEAPPAEPTTKDCPLLLSQYSN